MAREGTASTLPAHFRELLRRAIIRGEHRPGSRLAPAALAAQYQTSTTVMRETLMGLVAERMVIFQPNQGFFVLKLSMRDLEDITLVRTNSDCFALQLAIERGDVEWESRVIATYHRLSRTPRRYREKPSDDWAAAHREFHLALVEGCAIPMLVDQAKVLFDSTELYRRWTAPPVEARDVDSEHGRIVDATVARDTEKAVALLAEHYRTSLEIMRNSAVLDEASVENGAGRWR